MSDQPTPALTLVPPITDQGIAQVIDQVRQDYSNQLGARLTTAGGGTARIFGAVNKGQLAVAGYGQFSRGKGLEAGVEAIFTLRPKP